MKPFFHSNALSIDQALATLTEYEGKARLNAGGTDLYGLLKDEFLPDYPAALINIKTIPNLDYIREEQGMVRIGALAKLYDLANSSLLRVRYGALAAAAQAVASPQIRNTATLGGNLCQDVRCTYYRYPRHIGGPIQCARKGKGPCLAVTGDNRNHALFGGRKCFAVCPSDTAVALAAYAAELLVVGPEGERLIDLENFYSPLGTGLKFDEMIKEIRFPAQTGTERQTFQKFTLRKPIDFAIVSLAARLTVENGRCSAARIVIGAVAPGPHRARAAENFLLGRPIDDETATRAGELAMEGARALSRNVYKIEIAQALVKKAVLGETTG
jgi:xanthine dehydrogenase YagS FAD-binding subunit